MDLQATRVPLDQARQFREPGDVALGAGQIGHVRESDERHEVVLAQRREGDVTQHHHLVVTGVEDRREHALRLPPQAGELLLAGSRHPCRGVAQAVSVRVLADGQQDLPDRVLDTPEIDPPGQ